MMARDLFSPPESLPAPAGPPRPALRWHGGKWRLAPWIIAHFPPHRVYVEPYGGAASVLLRKPRAYDEIYNDLDGEVVSFFRTLRDDDAARRLVHTLKTTPFARAEFVGAYEHTDDPVERARRLVMRSFMGFGSNAHASKASGPTSTGFRGNSNRSRTTSAHDWRSYPDALRAVVERFRGVVVEEIDAVRLLAKYDRADVLFYVDPPYLHETRSLKKAGGGVRGLYAHEMSNDDHARLLAALRRVSGMVVLSGYPSDLYDEALAGWRRIETAARADHALPRREVLWINEAAAAASDSMHSASLFSIEEGKR